MESTKHFTMIPQNNEEFYSKGFNILHAYIVERVRGFESSGKMCYISNEQLSNETGSSISTITRAIKLLSDKKELFVTYHQENEFKKQRVLRIYKKKSDSQNDQLSKKSDSQNDKHRLSNCLSEVVKMTISDSQNDELEYKKNIKENNKNISITREPVHSLLSPSCSMNTQSPNNNLDSIIKIMVDRGAKGDSTLIKEEAQRIANGIVKLQDSYDEASCFGFVDHKLTGIYDDMQW